MTTSLNTWTDFTPGGGTAVCLGNFDGVHLGHLKILKTCIERARSQKLGSVLFTFEPHPRKFFQPKTNEPKLLLTLEEKKELLAKLNFDFLLFQDFNSKFSAHSPESFIEEILVRQLKASCVVIGRDFRFGKAAKGNAKTFLNYRELELELISDFRMEGESLSSTKIRKLVQSGEIEKANRFLGYTFFCTGKVVHGDKRGKQLGFPTANIETNKECMPSSGVYVSIVQDLDSGHFFPAVSNLGTRPSFTDSSQVWLESHLIQFKDDCYERNFRHFFLSQIRDEKSFASTEDLKSQISEDRAKAVEFFSKSEKFSVLWPGEKKFLSLNSNAMPTLEVFESFMHF